MAALPIEAVEGRYDSEFESCQKGGAGSKDKFNDGQMMDEIAVVTETLVTDSEELATLAKAKTVVSDETSGATHGTSSAQSSAVFAWSWSGRC